MTSPFTIEFPAAIDEVTLISEYHETPAWRPSKEEEQWHEIQRELEGRKASEHTISANWSRPSAERVARFTPVTSVPRFGVRSTMFEAPSRNEAGFGVVKAREPGSTCSNGSSGG